MKTLHNRLRKLLDSYGFNGYDISIEPTELIENLISIKISKNDTILLIRYFHQDMDEDSIQVDVGTCLHILKGIEIQRSS